MSNAIFHSDFFSEISLLLQNFHSLQVSISQEQAKKHQKAILEKSFPIAEEGNNVLTYSPKKCLHMKYFCFQKKMIFIPLGRIISIDNDIHQNIISQDTQAAFFLFFLLLCTSEQSKSRCIRKEVIANLKKLFVSALD